MVVAHYISKAPRSMMLRGTVECIIYFQVHLASRQAIQYFSHVHAASLVKDMEANVCMLDIQEKL